MPSNERVIAGNSREGTLTYNGHYYVGTCYVPSTGRFDRKKFDMPRHEALRMWREWCGRLRAADLEKRTEAVKAKPRAADVESKEDVTVEQKAGERKIYALCVVGGASLYVFESFDKACSVCDALTMAAKASGFSAKYDVVEVKRWVD